MKKFILILLVGSLILGTFSIPKKGIAQEERRNMESMIRAFRGQRVEHYVFTNRQGNGFLVVPEFGARILAVSVGGENLFWTHPNILMGRGGQRSWISPEGGDKGFIFKPDWTENRDFSMMDPGGYTVISFEENDHIVLENRFTVDSNDEKEKYDLALSREIRFKEDPLVDDPDFNSSDYSFLGIDFVHKLKNNTESTFDRILALWSLIQVPPLGTMIVPVHDEGKEAWRGNYFEPVPEKFVKENPESLSFYIHGSQRYKIGFKPQSVKGVISYIMKAEGDETSIVFMTFPVKPKDRYVDRPKSEQQTNGDAIQIYSHLEEGALAFGELECHSWGLELLSGKEEAFPIEIYMYKSSLDVLKKIGAKLISSDFEKAYLFE
jgi:hypothetical protein